MRKLIIIVVLLFVFVPFLAMADFFGSGEFGYNIQPRDFFAGCELGYNFSFLAGTEIDLYGRFGVDMYGPGVEPDGDKLFYMYNIDYNFGGKLLLDEFFIKVEHSIIYDVELPTFGATSVSVGFEF